MSRKITFGIVSCLISLNLISAEKKQIKAIYIPLADHYAGIIAYEKYKDQMVHADYKLERMKNWQLLRSYFREDSVDMAYIICPQAMDMFRKKPDFRWVSLMHRDGNALAINEELDKYANVERKRIDRKPDGRIAQAFKASKEATGRQVQCGVPHLHSTHTVVLYKYLKDNNLSLGVGRGENKDVLALSIAPPKSPSFIKRKNTRSEAASFEQSLPWADVVETQNYGVVGWYSKDVIPWKNGHVECIAVAKDSTISDKHDALKEVIYYIHKAGQDIEQARHSGGKALEEISMMIRKHIPEHNHEAIVQSLRPDLMVINYKHLNLDRKGLKVIMDLAVEAGIIDKGISIDAFANDQFATEITEQ